MSIQIFKNYEHILRESKCAFSISKKKGGNEIKMVVGLTEIKETELENMTMNLKPNEIKNEEEGTMKLSLYESRIFGRISYGYASDEKGIVYIKEDEAEIVKWMYQMCIAGHSLLQIQAELLRNEIKSPSGKEEWLIVTINKIIDNYRNCPHIVSYEDFRLATGEKLMRARNDRARWR